MKMNKNKIKLISILATSAILLTAVICICAFVSAKKAADVNEEKSSETESQIYTPPVYDAAQGDGEGSSDEEPDEPYEEETTTAERSLQYLSNGNGTCTVTGIGSITDTCVIIPEKSPSGEVVTNIGEKAFYGNKDINAVQIPSTVTSIGNMAFGGCTSLIYISVSAENTKFCDEGGILFSADGKTLIHYPALKGNSSLKISGEVTSISAMAFYGCNSLELIEFEGTMETWASISIGEFNYGLFSASIVCSDSKK